MRFVWTPIFIVFSLAGTLGFFQNCTPAVPFGNTDNFQALVNSPTFPYEVGIDQVAYMSCAEQDDIYNDGTFFTFRVGSYNNYGIRISQEYRDNIKKVADEDVPYALSQAQASSNTRLFLSARPIDNLQLMFRDDDNGDDGLAGFDHDSFFPTIGDEDLNTILWNMIPLDYLRTYAPARTINEYRFEGELSFMKSERMEMDLRRFFSGKGLLTLTFAESGSVFPVGPGSLTQLQDLNNRGQSGNVSLPSPGVGSASVNAASTNLATNVFGVAIKPRFKQPLPNGAGPDMPPRVLSSIQDVVIDERMQRNIEPQWDCPDDMQFMIVLPEHAVYQDASNNTITRCATNPDPIGNGNNNLDIIRQSILAEDFYVDTIRKCVVPKPDHTTAGSCYGKDNSSQTTYQINYDSFVTNGCGFGNANGLCPHFVSICYRLNN